MNDSVYDQRRDGYRDLERDRMQAGYVNQSNNNFSLDFKWLAKILISMVGFFAVFTLYSIKDTVSEMAKGFQTMREDVAVLKNDVVNIKDTQRFGSERGQRIDTNVQSLVEKDKKR